MSRKTKEQPPEADQQFLNVLERAARSLDWLLPETPEEVKAWEEAEEREARDTQAGAVAEPVIPFSSAAQAPEKTAIEDHLARAAREGTGEIAAETEDAMRRDREHAERDQS